MKKTIKIQGTHCNACKFLIEDIASEIQGIKSCNVDFKTGNTEVEYDEQIDWNKFKKEIESAGSYEVQL